MMTSNKLDSDYTSPNRSCRHTGKKFEAPAIPTGGGEVCSQLCSLID
jgi:hypothetical protein